jgi:hypothetical protein
MAVKLHRFMHIQTSSDARSRWRRAMFAYITGEPLAVAQQKAALRQQAQVRWPFLTSLDLSTLHGELQLTSMVKDRTGESLSQASTAVRRWAEEQAGILLPKPTVRETDWESEGGAARPIGPFTGVAA